MPDTFTHGDKFAIKGMSRMFFITAINEKAYLSTSQGTLLSERSAEYIDNILTEEGLKHLMGKHENFKKIGILPMPYGIMTENTKSMLSDGKYAIEVYEDGEWKRKRKSADFNSDLTYRGVRPICQTCGHTAS